MELKKTERNMTRIRERGSLSADDVLNFIYDFDADLKESGGGIGTLAAQKHDVFFPRILWLMLQVKKLAETNAALVSNERRRERIEKTGKNLRDIEKALKEAEALETERREKEAGLQEKAAELAERKEEADLIKAHCDQMETEIKSLRAVDLDAIRKKEAELGAELERKQHEAEAAQNLEKELREKETRLLDEKASLEKINTEAGRINAHCMEMEAAIKSVKPADLPALQKKEAETEAALAEKQKVLETAQDLEKQLREREAQLDEKMRALQEVQQKADQIRSRCTKLEHEIHRMETVRLPELEEEERGMNVRKAEIERELEEQKKINAAAKEEEKSLQESRKKFQDEAMLLKQNRLSQEQEKKKLASETEALKLSLEQTQDECEKEIERQNQLRDERSRTVRDAEDTLDSLRAEIHELEEKIRASSDETAAAQAKEAELTKWLRDFGHTEHLRQLDEMQDRVEELQSVKNAIVHDLGSGLLGVFPADQAEDSKKAAGRLDAKIREIHGQIGDMQRTLVRIADTLSAGNGPIPL